MTLRWTGKEVGLVDDLFANEQERWYVQRACQRILELLEGQSNDEFKIVVDSDALHAAESERDRGASSG